MPKTYMQKTAEVKREWHVIDATNKVVGKIAVEIAERLMGKFKTTYTPHIDGGDYVVVINAAKIAVTSNKGEKKMYYRHSHFPGGITGMTFNELVEKKPEEIIQRAVYNMLPKNKLRQGRMARLKVYRDAEHKHQSQLGASN